MDNDNDNDNDNPPDSPGVIEPELMADEEVDTVARDRLKPGFHYKKVVFGANPDGSTYSRVETENGSGMPPGLAKPPVVAAWLCLIISWLLLSSPVPFTVLLGVPAGLAALYSALICLARGAFGTALLVFILGTVGSVIVYLVGLLRFLA